MNEPGFETGAAMPLAEFPVTHAVAALDATSIHVWFGDTQASSARGVRDAARLTLERLLVAYAGLARPPRIETGAHGKPFAPDLVGLDFNLSHAGSHVIVAIARGQAIGIDIESRARRVSVEGVAARFFSAAEAAWLANLAPERQHDAFLRLWTHKEAVLKALGDGLSFGLDRLEFELAADGEVGGLRRIAAEAGAPTQWHLRRVAPAPGLFGSLAWRGRARSLHGFRFQP